MKAIVVRFAFALALFAASICAAHPAQYVAANVKINRDGTFQVLIRLLKSNEEGPRSRGPFLCTMWFGPFAT